MENPTPVGKYLGCDHIIKETISPITGKKVRSMRYDMTAFLKSCIAVYNKHSGNGDKPIKPSPTPFLEDPTAGNIDSTMWWRMHMLRRSMLRSVYCRSPR